MVSAASIICVLSAKTSFQKTVAQAQIDGKLYCASCYEYNEETDEYEVKNDRNKNDYGMRPM